jgi:glutathione S-transferase
MIPCGGDGFGNHDDAPRGGGGGRHMVWKVYGHPFSSFTQKVLVALHERGDRYELLAVSPDQPANVAEWLQHWPLRKFPVLVDDGTSVAEASIIIEYLELTHPRAVRLLPPDAGAALEVRFLDRFFDLHVQGPMQAAVSGALTGDPARRAEGLAHAAEKCALAYAWLDGHLARRTWAAGDAFSLADCAAAPALFYADWIAPIGGGHPAVRAYRERLLTRPSFARAVDAARPFRHLFPLPVPDRD